MKRILKTLILTVIVSILALSAISCGGGLNGRYVMDDDEAFVTMTELKFKGNKVDMTEYGLTVEGEYEIEGDTLYITVEMFGMKTTEDFAFENHGDYITLDGVKFTKK